MKDRTINLLIIGMIAACLGFAGSMDVDDEEWETQRYCQNVEAWTFDAMLPEMERAGHPDYDDRYARDCR